LSAERFAPTTSRSINLPPVILHSVDSTSAATDHITNSCYPNRPWAIEINGARLSPGWVVDPTLLSYWLVITVAVGCISVNAFCLLQLILFWSDGFQPTTMPGVRLARTASLALTQPMPIRWRRRSCSVLISTPSRCGTTYLQQLPGRAGGCWSGLIEGYMPGKFHSQPQRCRTNRGAVGRSRAIGGSLKRK
jgi:hypothetical protein